MKMNLYKLALTLIAFFVFANMNVQHKGQESAAVYGCFAALFLYFTVCNLIKVTEDK